MSTYTKHFNTKTTAQTSPVPGKKQVKNEAGGFAFEADAWTRFNRFLILGTEGGTYYTTEQAFTTDNAENVVKVIKSDGLKAVEHIIQVSDSGRAPKNDPAIFSLALACTFGDEDVKKAAYSGISKVCRTGTHLFTFAENVQSLRGWSRGLRNGVAKFYTEKTNDQVAMQLVKYRQRNGWTHKDVLRLAHPVGKNLEMNQLFAWAVGKDLDKCQLNDIVSSFEELQKLKDTNPKKSIELIKEYKLPWETLPTELLNEKKIWDALLENMPMTAMIRNLGKMTSLGVLDSNLSKNVKHVRSVLENAEALKKSRIHPMSILLATKTYEQGHGIKGSLSWKPVQGILDSLNEAFYETFDNVEPTGLNTLVAVDSSGSMGSSFSNYPMSVVEAASAMALVTLNVEPNAEVIGFDTSVHTPKLSAKMRLDDVVNKIGTPGGGTDCSLPFQYAQSKKLKVDSFITLTDTQTWSGGEHVFQALNKYRKSSGLNSKSVEVAMTASGTSNNDPTDLNCLNVVGFDTATPQAISEFLKG